MKQRTSKFLWSLFCKAPYPLGDGPTQKDKSIYSVTPGLGKLRQEDQLTGKYYLKNLNTGGGMGGEVGRRVKGKEGGIGVGM